MTDLEDFTFATENVEDVVTDAPDWTDTVEDQGGGAGGYASLTGPGETVTPGELDQAGPFVVLSNGCTIDIDHTQSGVAHSVLLVSAGQLIESALGISASANSYHLQTNPGNITFDTIGAVTVRTGGFSAQNGATITYGIAGAGAGSSPGIIFEDLGTSATVNMYVHAGNPNGVITPITGTSGLCFDITTPKLWAWVAGSGTWVGI